MDSRNVSSGKPAVGGAIFSAPAGTPLPEDAVEPLSDSYQELGYAAEDGVKNTVSTSSNSVKAWGGDEVLNEVSERSEEFGVKLIETNAATLIEVYGEANVSVEDNGFAVLHNSKALPEKVYVFEIVLSPTRVKRIAVPRAKILEVGEVVYNGKDPVGYDAKIAALPDKKGNTAYEYIADIDAEDLPTSGGEGGE